ncbi:hypothetical protein BJ508DRAFT_307244 [Ascobolus immersus RN42]|uniref:Uncharacterized protein n=1 Tax=Ascobolus immersus RN42 TaxID=1160509 RepID=A0A3N4I8Z0_ASCIM|nr:hypothetical protein BJ508DRAFT_307244 [Ascobolus immersus RN42]
MANLTTTTTTTIAPVTASPTSNTLGRNDGIEGKPGARIYDHLDRRCPYCKSNSHSNKKYGFCDGCADELLWVEYWMSFRVGVTCEGLAEKPSVPEPRPHLSVHQNRSSMHPTAVSDSDSTCVSIFTPTKGKVQINHTRLEHSRIRSYLSENVSSHEQRAGNSTVSFVRESDNQSVWVGERLAGPLVADRTLRGGDIFFMRYLLSYARLHDYEEKEVDEWILRNIPEGFFVKGVIVSASGRRLVYVKSGGSMSRDVSAVVLEGDSWRMSLSAIWMWVSSWRSKVVFS